MRESCTQSHPASTRTVPRASTCVSAVLKPSCDHVSFGSPLKRRSICPKISLARWARATIASRFCGDEVVEHHTSLCIAAQAPYVPFRQVQPSFWEMSRGTSHMVTSALSKGGQDQGYRV